MISITPTRLVRYNSRKGKKMNNDTKINSLKNLNKGYKQQRIISESTRKEIIKKISWLNYIANPKVYTTKKGDSFVFKLSMITLTLPSAQLHDDKEIVKTSLNNWLTLMRSYYGMNNYVWRAETQANGNIHFHIITDADINYYVMLYSWNKCLDKLDYVKNYTKKFNSLSKKEYINYRINQKQKLGLKFKESKERFQLSHEFDKMKKDGFRTPRTVNLRRIIDLNKIENYVSKYLSKGSKERRIVTCRHTGNSYSLSNIKESFELLQVELNNYFDYCYQILKKPIVNGDYWQIINIRAFEHLNEFLNVDLKDHLKKTINLEPSEEIRRNLIEDKLNYKFHFN